VPPAENLPGPFGDISKQHPRGTESRSKPTRKSQYFWTFPFFLENQQMTCCLDVLIVVGNRGDCQADPPRDMTDISEFLPRWRMNSQI